MTPESRSQATLVDLLDRALTKGLVIHADLVVSVAGIPLIGVNLRAALAGMETMVKYGLLTDWDAKIRAKSAQKNADAKKCLSQSQEPVIFSAPASWYGHTGLTPAWRYGHLYLFKSRILIHQHPFQRTLVEWPLSHMVHLFPASKSHKNIYGCEILLENGEFHKIR